MPAYSGSNITMAVEFTINDVDTDPTGITFSLYKDGTLLVTYVFGTDAQVVKTSTGNYYVDYEVTASGLYWYQWVGTGAVIATNWDSFSVQPNPV